MKNTHTFTNDVTIVNTTPHPITFWDEGDEALVTIPSDSDYVINAKVEEAVVNKGGIELVTPKFIPCEEGYSIINRIHKECGKEVIIIGSILAAQSYPGLVYGMVPCIGYERVAPAEKRMRCDKFTTYGA